MKRLKAIWANPVYRRLIAGGLGIAVALSCNLWPAYARPLCQKLSPLFDALGR